MRSVLHEIAARVGLEEPNALVEEFLRALDADDNSVIHLVEAIRRMPGVGEFFQAERGMVKLDYERQQLVRDALKRNPGYHTLQLKASETYGYVWVLVSKYKAIKDLVIDVAKDKYLLKILQDA